MFFVTYVLKALRHEYLKPHFSVNSVTWPLFMITL